MNPLPATAELLKMDKANLLFLIVFVGLVIVNV